MNAISFNAKFDINLFLNIDYKVVGSEKGELLSEAVPGLPTIVGPHQTNTRARWLASSKRGPTIVGPQALIK